MQGEKNGSNVIQLCDIVDQGACMIEQSEKSSTRPVWRKWGCLQREEEFQESGLHEEKENGYYKKSMFWNAFNHFKQERMLLKDKRCACRKSCVWDAGLSLANMPCSCFETERWLKRLTQKVVLDVSRSRSLCASMLLTHFGRFAWGWVRVGLSFPLEEWPQMTSFLHEHKSQWDLYFE